MNLTPERRTSYKWAAILAGIVAALTIITRLGLFGGIDAPTREEFTAQATEIEEHIEEQAEVNKETIEILHEIKEEQGKQSVNIEWMRREQERNGR